MHDTCLYKILFLKSVAKIGSAAGGIQELRIGYRRFEFSARLISFLGLMRANVSEFAPLSSLIILLRLPCGKATTDLERILGKVLPMDD